MEAASEAAQVLALVPLRLVAPRLQQLQGLREQHRLRHRGRHLFDGSWFGVVWRFGGCSLLLGWRFLRGSLLLGGSLLGRSLFLGCSLLLGRSLLFWLLVANQTLAIGLASYTIGLGVDDARGMALHTDSERVAEVQGLLVGQPQLSCQFVYA